jgi:co-chaperonin GroES (HSP10)
MNLLGDLIAVRYENDRNGVVALPDWKRALVGFVIAVGPDATETRTGDRISFGAAKGMEATFDGRAIRIMRDTDVDFVVEA